MRSGVYRSRGGSCSSDEEEAADAARLAQNARARAEGSARSSPPSSPPSRGTNSTTGSIPYTGMRNVKISGGGDSPSSPKSSLGRAPTAASSSGRDGNSPTSPKSSSPPAPPAGFRPTAPAPPSGERRRSLQMDETQMSSILTQMHQGSPRSPKAASPLASPSMGGAMLLPPLDPLDNQRCLVIDLDETLVHTEHTPSGFPGGRYDFKISVMIQGSTYRMYVKKRPGCDTFLRKAAENYELVIFTASLEPYCRAVMRIIDPAGLVKHQLHRTHCTLHEGLYVKDLSRLGRSIKDCILLDNNPDCYLLQPRNAIPINSWYDDMKDRDLEDVLNLLQVIAESPKTAVMMLDEFDRKLGWARGQPQSPIDEFVFR